MEIKQSGQLMHQAEAAFFLERFVHHCLQADTQRCTHVATEARRVGMNPTQILMDMVWPTMECVQQLHRDGTAGVRTYNAAMRILTTMTSVLAEKIGVYEPVTAAHRAMMVMTSPGEDAELGAHILSALAEAHGWTVFFAGAGMSIAEITFSIGQLRPDVLAIHGTFVSSALRARLLMEKLRRIHIWPGIQVAVAGGITGTAPEGRNATDADIVARHPVELLELLALCPEYRACPSPQKCSGKGSLELPLELAMESISLSSKVIQQAIASYLNTPRTHRN